MTPNYSAGMTGLKRARNRRYHVVHRRGGCRQIPFHTSKTPKKSSSGDHTARCDACVSGRAANTSCRYGRASFRFQKSVRPCDYPGRSDYRPGMGGRHFDGSATFEYWNEHGLPILKHRFAVDDFDAFGSALEHIGRTETPHRAAGQSQQNGLLRRSLVRRNCGGRSGPPTGTTMNHLALESSLSKSMIVPGRFR